MRTRGKGEGAGGGPEVDPPSPTQWRLRDRTLGLDTPVVMGIINLTPDSFSDGGEFDDPERALDRAHAMVEEGAGIIDVGGESTRPGAREIPEEEELRRILPFVRAAVSRLPVPVSVDTRKSAVADAALEEGAHVINDVSGLSHDPELGTVVARWGAGLVLMHMRGTPADMRERARYRDVAGEVRSELEAALTRALDQGVSRECLAVDPGIGFAKTPAQSFELLARLETLHDLGRPLVVGPSRKSFLGALLERPPRERVAGTIAASVLAALRGARILRVHDVREVSDALRVVQAVAEGHE